MTDISLSATMTADNLETGDSHYRTMVCFGHVHMINGHLAALQADLFSAVSDGGSIARVLQRLDHMRGALDRVGGDMLALAARRGENPNAAVEVAAAEPMERPASTSSYSFGSDTLGPQELSSRAEQALAKACMAAHDMSFRGNPDFIPVRGKRLPRQQARLTVTLPAHTHNSKLRAALKIECEAVGITLIP